MDMEESGDGLQTMEFASGTQENHEKPPPVWSVSLPEALCP
jgi:hypothetical protein